MSEWSIVLAEQTMDLGIWDRLVYGQDTCHSFLALVNPEGEVVSEIHGTTFHPDTGKLSYKGQSFQTFAKAIACSAGVSEPFMSAVEKADMDHHWPRLKVAVTNGMWRLDKVEPDHQQVVLSGSKEEVVAEWLDACELGLRFNKLDEYYMPFSARIGGRNCNSVTALMLHAMDVDTTHLEFSHASVGFNNKLVERHEELAAFNTRQTYDPDELDSKLFRMIKGPWMIFHRTDRSHREPVDTGYKIPEDVMAGYEMAR